MLSKTQNFLYNLCSYCRFISPVTPFFPDTATKSFKQKSSDKQAVSREEQTPGKTPASHISRRNLHLEKDSIPTPMPLICKSAF